MHVDLTQLEEDELHIEHQYTTEQFDFADSELKLCTPPYIRIHLVRLGVEVRIRGHLTARLEASCDRCLKLFPLPVNVSFDVSYAPLETLAPEEERELNERDLSLGFYEKELIDIDALVREQIRLALPFRLLCREDCLGLCQKCGADLNAGPCGCLGEETDIRWAPLLEFKKQMN